MKIELSHVVLSPSGMKKLARGSHSVSNYLNEILYMDALDRIKTAGDNYKPRGQLYFFRWVWVIFLLIITNLQFLYGQIQTEIVRDGTVGNPDLSLQPTPGPDGVHEIGEEHGHRPGGGVNLFHSFSKFNVGSGDTALFTANQETANVISRVTGGDASQIFGTIKSEIAGANLFLLNPAGVMFGPNARLDVKGSFYASTADYLRLLDDDPEGMLTFTDEPRLAAANPIAFGFLNQPVEINVDRSVLKVPEGETLSLVAGDITITGEPRGMNGDGSELDCTTSCLKAPGGRIQFATGTADSEIPIDGSELDSEDLQLEGTVEVSDNMRIDVSGDSGGSIIIRAGEFSIESTEIIADTQGDVDGNPLALDVIVSGSVQLTKSIVRARTTGDGTVGAIQFRGDQIKLRDGARVSNETGVSARGSGSGSGGGGSNGGSGGGSNGGSGGGSNGGSGGGSNGGSGGGSNGGSGGGSNGGSGGGSNGGSGGGSNGGSGGGSSGGSGGGSGGGGEGQESGDSSGTGGDIVIIAEKSIEVVKESEIFANSNSSGNAGIVRFEAADVHIKSGSRIGNNAEASGNGGNIFIFASKSLTLTGTQTDPNTGQNRGSRITAASRAAATGDAGSINIEAPVVMLGDGARITSSSEGVGEGGGITILARESISVSGQRLDGQGSSIRASAECGGDFECVDVDEPRLGNAGDLLIKTPILTLEKDAEIVTNTSLQGKAGNLELDVANLKMTSAKIQSISTGKGSGNAGNIFIGVRSDGGIIENPTQNVALTGSNIETIAEDAGGGNITINGNGSLRLQNESAIDASDTGGEGGNVRINMKRDVVVFDTSKILARAAIAGGEGGFIEITTDAFIQAQGTVVDAENAVVINAPETNLAGELASLNTDFLDAPGLLQPVCEARIGGGRTGSFVASRSGNLQPSPDDVMIGFQKPPEIESMDEITGQERNVGGSTRDKDRQFLEKARLSGTPLYLAQALSDSARATFQAPDPEETFNLVQEAVDVTIALPDSGEKLNVLIHLAKTAEGLARTSALYQKRSLLLAYKTLTEASSLAEDIGDTRSKSYVLGNLGSLYQIENRFHEALQLTRLALTAAEHANANDAIYRWYWQEGQIQWALGRSQEAIDAYRHAVNILSEIRSEVQEQNRSSDIRFRLSVAPVYLDLVDTLLQTADRVTNHEDQQMLLHEARSVVEQLKSAELRDYFRDDCVTELEDKEIELEHVSKNSAVIYPIQLSDRLELLVSLPSGLKRFSVNVNTNDFTSEVRKFRQELEIRGLHRYLSHSQKLYDWLIRPIEPDFASSAIETLVFVPDGPLLTIPFAALHDGDQFLIDKYAIATTPGLNLTDPQPLQRENLNVLAVGLSESVQGFPPLPHVGSELDSIHGLYRGEQLIDHEFTDPALERVVKENQFNIVHIASHGQFKSESENTFILMFDNKLSVERLNQLVGQFKYRDKPLELLTLSACETAAGDDRAALGLAGIAIRAGARSALGTLWLINDKASSLIVTEFYQQLKNPSNSRAAALQRAQLECIDDKRYSHPYYWSPFLLVNNWL